MHQVLETNVALLVCCLLALSFAATTPTLEDLTTTLASSTVTIPPTKDLTHTTVTPVSTTNNDNPVSTTDTKVSPTDPSVSPDHMTVLTGTTLGSTAASASSQASTRRSTTQPPDSTTAATTWTFQTFTTTNPEDETSTQTHQTRPATPPADGGVAEGLNLNNSDRNMMIIFSVVLIGFVLGSVIYLLHRCKQRLQYSHHPLYNTDQFEADDDTLVISGGLYDGHAVFDQPAPTTDASLHLNFLNDRDRIPTF